MREQQNSQFKTCLTLGGLDPSGAAGILLDCAVFKHFNFHPQAIATCLTKQNFSEMSEVVEIEPPIVLDQLDLLLQEHRPAAIKIGALTNPSTLRTICKQVSELAIPLVCDPILASSNGTAFIKQQLNPEDYIGVTLLTPNLLEAASLARTPINSLSEVKNVAARLATQYGYSVLIKGGHLLGPATDILAVGTEVMEIQGIHPRIITEKIRGTGCFLSAAIACLLGSRQSLAEACREAKNLVESRLQTAILISKDIGVFS